MWKKNSFAVALGIMMVFGQPVDILRVTNGSLRIGNALAAPVRLDLEPGAVVFLRKPQSDLFKPGGLLAIKAEYLPLAQLSILINLSLLVAPAEQGDPGMSYNMFAGVRVRPLSRSVHDRRWASGFFMDASAGFVRTDVLNRFGLEAGLGYEFSLHRMWRLGPFARYYYVLQPGGRPRIDPSDAHAVWVGLGVSFDFAPPVTQRRQGCSDRDNDRICDFEDKCPDNPEDLDGFEDGDGCPDPDNDGDRVPDKQDQCPGTDKDKKDNFAKVREDHDGFEDEDGCPDPDNDGDGVPDKQDRCPGTDKDKNDNFARVKEDKDGFEDEDGCPDPDNDNDGVPDKQDQCPGTDRDKVNNFIRVKEDKDGFMDEDGCPDPDNDNDGFPDKKDKCPNQPETVNCYKDDDGCPDDILHITDKVLYSSDSSRLRRDAKSMLKKLAAMVIADKGILRLRIEGHTDISGSISYNDKLSLKRARKVLDFMIREGIEPGRIEALGYGERCPVASRHKKNRRVVFRIVCPKGPGNTVELSKNCPPTPVLRDTFFKTRSGAVPQAAKPRTPPERPSRANPQSKSHKEHGRRQTRSTRSRHSRSHRRKRRKRKKGR